MKIRHGRTIGYGIVAVVLWLVLWQLAAMKIDRAVFLPAPLAVWNALKKLLVSAEFYQSIAGSLGNVMKGTVLACAVGILSAATAANIPFLKIFIGFPVRVMQATPVASFTILALFWLDAENLSVLVSFLMVLPLFYSNVLAGIEATDEKLLEMAQIFQVRRSSKIRFIYVPEVLPYFLSACSVAAGVAWKSGIAAEVIGVVRNTIGNHLYQSKIYLEMPELFAWTVVIICVSIIFEQGLLFLVHLLENYMLDAEPARKEKECWKTADVAEAVEPSVREAICFENVTKQFDDTVICQAFSMQVDAGEKAALMGASGIGKTTILRMLLGLEQPDAGTIRANVKETAVVFQEDRLCEKISVYHNLSMICKTKEQLAKVESVLGRLGLAGCIHKKAAVLSGGMKRRVAIARALLAERQVLLLDEPLKGLDEETRHQVMQFIKEKMNGKTVLYITHEEDEARYFECRVIKL